VTTGHVFHPGHEPLHGVTVVVEGASGTCWVGRYHERTDRGILLLDVAVHQPGEGGIPREEWLARIRKFGVRPAVKNLVIPDSEAPRIGRLVELE